MKTTAGQLSLLETLESDSNHFRHVTKMVVTKKEERYIGNSSFIGTDDYELSRETTKNGYDLERPARVYMVTKKGTVQNLWLVSTRDAMKICQHEKSQGRGRGGEWMYCWTQHDVQGEIDSALKNKYVDDGRLKKFEGLEDVRILRSFT